MTEDILNSQQKEFKHQVNLIKALEGKGLLETYATLKTENGGYIGVPLGDERLSKPDKPKPTGKKKTLVRVFRANCDEANRDNVIKVTANGPAGRKVFLPGEEVWLSDVQLNILRDSVVTNEIFIDAGSGIYSAKNPEVAAKNQYPNMRVSRDETTGRIFVWRNIPNYIIEKLEHEA